MNIIALTLQLAPPNIILNEIKNTYAHWPDENSQEMIGLLLSLIKGIDYNDYTLISNVLTYNHQHILQLLNDYPLPIKYIKSLFKFIEKDIIDYYIKINQIETFHDNLIRLIIDSKYYDKVNNDSIVTIEDDCGYMFFFNFSYTKLIPFRYI